MKITKEGYLKMREQLGKEPLEKDTPPDLDDFPHEVQQAIILFNKLGDRVYPDIGYLGKDYTQLPIYLDILEVEERAIFLETLLRLDSKVIKKSAKKLEAERKKLAQQAKKK